MMIRSLRPLRRTAAIRFSGGDAELCYALRLTGWRLWYEPGLRMSHFLPADRLRWDYVRRISRGFGAATAGIDSYELAVKGARRTLFQRLRRSWGWQTFATFRRLLGKPIKCWRASRKPMEGDGDVLQIENLWGRLVELLHHRRSYVSSLKTIRALQRDQATGDGH